MQSQIENNENRMSLKERIKTIFAIASHLKNGLATLGRGVGDGLKAIGKKLGQILPGMLGAIVSFIFRTAGEVLGFLGKHAWLLIVAVVMYVIEQFKKKRS